MIPSNTLIYFISDLHIGRVTDGVDRVKEVVNAFERLKVRINKDPINCKKIVVIGGDVFDKNNPNEKHIALFISILNMFKGMGVMVYVMSGNHDSIAEYGRYSCLSFIRELSSEYDYVELVDKIKHVYLDTFDSGPHYLVFLPHINFAHLRRSSYSEIQKYINARVAKIYKEIGPGAQTIVFSHLDIKKYLPIDSDNTLNRAVGCIPNKLMTMKKMPLGTVKPLIISGHYHKSDKYKNVHIIGAPLCLTFGEIAEKKYFAKITVHTQLSQAPTVKLVSTKADKFVQIDLDLTSYKDDLQNKIIEAVNKKVSKKMRGHLKIDLVLKEFQVGAVDWKKLKDRIEGKYCMKVKDIKPKIVRDSRQVRNSKMKLGLKPLESLHIYLKEVMKLDRDIMERVEARAELILNNRDN
jgi:DNA repair exonuclease SbcCD nuclease subunit